MSRWETEEMNTSEKLPPFFETISTERVVRFGRGRNGIGSSNEDGIGSSLHETVSRPRSPTIISMTVKFGKLKVAHISSTWGFLVIPKIIRRVRNVVEMRDKFMPKLGGRFR